MYKVFPHTYTFLPYLVLQCPPPFFLLELHMVFKVWVIHELKLA